MIPLLTQNFISGEILAKFDIKKNGYSINPKHSFLF